MKKICIFLLTLSIITVCKAQKHDYVWTFGKGDAYPSFGGTNINFNKTPPDTDYVKRAINFGFDCASICDERGNLLFCTNGCKIFSGKNRLVKNGTGLNPGILSTQNCPYGNLMTQGSLFLPHPKDTSLYYLFHLRPEFVEKNALGGIGDKIYYTLLDKRGDNGNGEVLSKNNIIHEDTLAFGKMTAVRHGNGRDWWIVVPRMLKNQYIKLLLTSEGIKGPFFQNIGLKNLDDDGTGQAVFSPDGTKYIHFDRYNDLNIFDFDRCTGKLSNTKHILLPIAGDSIVIQNDKYPKYTVGGVAVSSNSKYLYVTTEPIVYQYNLKAIDIEKSYIEVAQYDGFISDGSWTSFYVSHIAPDNKIYITCTGDVKLLHVINNPDEEGLACNVKQHSFQLPTYKGFSIPNFPNFRLGKIDKAICETPIAAKETQNDINFSIFPNPSNGQLTLQHKSENTEKIVWELYNNMGILIYQKTIQSTNNQENINIDYLLDGMYFWHLKSKEKIVQSGKLLLIK
jgi:hypothetical protein